MAKCDACKQEAVKLFPYDIGALCESCGDSRYEYDGSDFDWCIARHAELQAKQPAAQPSPTDAELIALAGLAQAEVVALAVSSEACPPHQPASMSDFYALPVFAALASALKSRGVIK